MITEDPAECMSTLAERLHADCIACGAANQRGLQLQFTVCPDGSVETTFPCHRVFQGYDGILHGGIISCLLDSAMTNCLFSRGIAATTGELTLRFHHPVAIDCPAVVRARVERSRSPLHIVEAELLQDDDVQVRAIGKFMEMRSEVGLGNSHRNSEEGMRDWPS